MLILVIFINYKVVSLKSLGTKTKQFKPDKQLYTHICLPDSKIKNENFIYLYLLIC